MATARKKAPAAPASAGEWVLVDGEYARKVLANNPVNRRLSRATWARYAADMAEDRWLTNPQPIIIGPDGRLIDGQHRLTALVYADENGKPGVQVWFNVISAKDEVFDVIDQGRVRTAANGLEMHGMTQGNRTAAAAKLVLAYEKHPDKLWTGWTSYPNKTEIIKFVTGEAREEAESIQFGKTLASRAGLYLTPLNTLEWLVIRHSPNADRWDEFYDGLITGANLNEGDVRLVMRGWQSRTRSNSWVGQAALAVYIKGWNAYVTGAVVERLAFRRDELPMPEIA